MKGRKQIYVLILASLIANIGNAQRLPSGWEIKNRFKDAFWWSFKARVKEMPLKYISPEENTNLFPDTAVLPGNLWMVYYVDADISNNTQTSDLIVVNPEFLKQYYVVDENDDSLRLIYTSVPKINEYLTAYDENAGWIKKSELLLWESCLLENGSRYSNRVLLLGNRTGNNAYSSAKFYQNSDLSVEVKGKSSKLDIYYIYKETNKSYLLGIQPSFVGLGQNSKEYIAGWVSKDNVLKYDKFKYSYESNWDIEAAKERIDKKLPSKLYLDSVLQNPIGIFDYANIRKPGTYFRFLHEKSNSNNVRVLAFFSNSSIWNGQCSKLEDLDLNVVNGLVINDLYLFPAYIPMENFLNPFYYKKVVLISNLQLSEIISTIKQEQDILLENQGIREKLVNYYKQLFTDKNDAFFSINTINELYEIKFGVCNMNSTFGFSHIFDIYDDNKISEEALNLRKNVLSSRLKELEYIYNQNEYKYAFLSNGDKYYWVDINLLP